jgi:hypothetical protein
MASSPPSPMIGVAFNDSTRALRGRALYSSKTFNSQNDQQDKTGETTWLGK